MEFINAVIKKHLVNGWQIDEDMDPDIDDRGENTLFSRLCYFGSENFIYNRLCPLFSTVTFSQTYKFSDGRMTLSDFLDILRNPVKFNDHLKNYPNFVNLSIPQTGEVLPGYTLLHFCIRMASEERSSFIDRQCRNERLHVFISEYYYKIKACLDEGADVDAQDESGSTPIHLAFKLQEHEILKLFFNPQRTPIDFTNPDKITYLHIACAMNDANLARALLLYRKNEERKMTNVNVQIRNRHEWLGTSIPAGSTPLHIAVMQNNRKLVMLLLEHGADASIQDYVGTTAIHLSMTSYYHYGIRDLLLSSCENLKDAICRRSNLSHLHVAAFAGDLRNVKKLLENGADYKQPIRFLRGNHARNYFESLEGYRALDCAFHNNSKEVIDFFVRNGFRIDFSIAKRDYILLPKPAGAFFSTLLFECREQSNVKKFIKATGLTIMHVACLEHNADLLRQLLNSENLNVNLRCKSWDDMTPLHALFKQHTSFRDLKHYRDLLMLLFDHGADMMISDASGFTPLHRVFYLEIDQYIEEIFRGREKFSNNIFKLIAIVMLGQHQSYAVHPIDRHGVSHLHIACYRRNREVVEKYLQHGVDINLSVGHSIGFFAGNTALHFALLGDLRIDRKILELLLRHGADMNMKNAKGETPLNLLLAIKQSDVFECIELFFRHGCRVNNADSKDKCKNSKTLLMQLASDINSEMEKKSAYSLRSLIAAQMFQHYSSACDVGELDENGRNSIHNLVSANTNTSHHMCNAMHEHSIGRLLDYGCNINLQDKNGQTPLHLAAISNNVTGIETLLFYGADLNIIDCSGNTAYHYSRDLKIDKLFITAVSLMMHLDLKVQQQDAQKMCESFVYHAETKEISKVIEKCNRALETMGGKVIDNTSVTVKDFLLQKKFNAKYAMMSESQQQAVDFFFKHEVPEIQMSRKMYFRDEAVLLNPLLMQYRRAQSLEIISKILITAYPRLPILCLNEILNYL